MLIARDQPVAACRVRVELTAGLHGEVGGLLHRLDRKVPSRLDHDTPLAAHPGDNGRPVLVVMAPPGLAFLATTPWLAAQRFRPAFLGPSLPTDDRSHRATPHCATTNTSDSPCGHEPPTPWQYDERNTTGTAGMSRASSVLPSA